MNYRFNCNEINVKMHIKKKKEFSFKELSGMRRTILSNNNPNTSKAACYLKGQTLSNTASEWLIPPAAVPI